MFHVKQNSLDSDNLQGLSCILHMLQLSHPIFLPLPREGIKGRGCGRGREEVYVSRETFSPLFSEK